MTCNKYLKLCIAFIKPCRIINFSHYYLSKWELLSTVKRIVMRLFLYYLLWHIIWPDHCSLLCYLLLLYIKYLNLGGYLVESTIVDSHEIRPLAGICMSGTTWLFKYVVWMEWPTSISGPDSIYTLVKFGLKFCIVNVPKWAESCSTLGIWAY